MKKKHTSKNITLSLTDELREQMSKYPEVHWSEVARQGILSYIKHRRLLEGEQCQV